MTESAFDLTESARTGVELCRQGRWDQGFRTLCQVANADRQRAKLPSVFYSYLGLGMARYEKRYDDGEKLCQRAIEIEFFEPENYLNLAKVYGLRGKRPQAVEALRKGLQIDGSHQQLRDMLLELGVRKKPVLSFLSRDNPLNRLLGRIRHDVSSRPKRSSSRS
ncbi:MAG TPA: tetratricopeptide repeat protein [Thermoanaerobaculia bacterium]|nr:tetratricopeptide repeat protein [Thermoanaerobaculia bacterium]